MVRRLKLIAFLRFLCYLPFYVLIALDDLVSCVDERLNYKLYCDKVRENFNYGQPRKFKTVSFDIAFQHSQRIRTRRRHR